MANKDLTKALLHGFTGAGLFKKLDYPGAPKEFVHMTPEGRELIGNTPTCEDCGKPQDHCTCEDAKTFIQDTPGATEYIDITPESLKTQEGIKRVSQAQKEWDDATHELANTLKRVIDEVFDRDTDKIARAEYYSELQTLIGIRDVKQEAFLRAVTGR